MVLQNSGNSEICFAESINKSEARAAIFVNGSTSKHKLGRYLNDKSCFLTGLYQTQTQVAKESHVLANQRTRRQSLLMHLVEKDKLTYRMTGGRTDPEGRRTACEHNDQRMVTTSNFIGFLGEGRWYNE